MILPEPVSRYIGSWIMDQRALGYIMLDRDGNIRRWGGELNQLGIKGLQERQPISDQLVFMEGLLPITESSVHLAMIKPDANHCLDVHLFHTEDGYGLIMMDATETERNVAVWQQQANEMALQKDKDPLAPTRDNMGATNAPLENFLGTLNIAALELNPLGQFRLIGQAPQWLSKLCPKVAAQPCQLSSQNTFSFLDNFLHDAHQLWRQDKATYIKSGLWIETDDEANEHLLEATALNSGQRKILLISRDTCMIDEKQAMIQKGRELALSQGLDKRLLDELEARVRLHTRELESANARLANELEHRKQLEKERTQMALHLQQSQKMEAIGTLAGGIAHDFNNILSAVIGFSELSMVEIPLGSQLYSNLQQVISAGERAKGLIHQILTFSRQTEPEVQPVHLGMLAKEALKLLRASLPAAIEIQQSIESQSIVMADPTQLHQVIMNLCTNASHAMRDHGGVLELRLSDRTVGIAEIDGFQDLQPGTYLELTVKDSGQGMPPDVMTRIFEPFFTTKAKGQGTGMGLSVVHGIVKNCKGAIQVASQPQAGSTFRVLLPSMPPMEYKQQSKVPDLPKGTERILFIDDEAALTKLAVQSLGMLGYHVQAETDCASALALFSKAPKSFDLVITDMNMPKMTGQQFAKKLLQIRPNVPIILCSGCVDAMTEKSLEKIGIKEYLMKPVALKKLAKTVRTILDAKETSSQ